MVFDICAVTCKSVSMEPFEGMYISIIITIVKDLLKVKANQFKMTY